MIEHHQHMQTKNTRALRARLFSRHVLLTHTRYAYLHLHHACARAHTHTKKHGTTKTLDEGDDGDATPQNIDLTTLFFLFLDNVLGRHRFLQLCINPNASDTTSFLLLQHTCKIDSCFQSSLSCFWWEKTAQQRCHAAAAIRHLGFVKKALQAHVCGRVRAGTHVRLLKCTCLVCLP